MNYKTYYFLNRIFSWSPLRPMLRYFILSAVLFCLVPQVNAQDKDKKLDPKNYPGNRPVVDKKAKKSANKDLVIKGKPTKEKDQGTRKITGKVPKPRSEGELKDNAGFLSGFTSKTPYVDTKRTTLKNARKESRYAGNISVRKLRNARRDKLGNQKETSSYTGNIRLTNITAERRQASRRIAQFRGNIPLKSVKKPRGSITSSYRGAPNRNRALAKYDKSALKKGTRMKKSDLPNYQKAKPTKLKYNAKEAQMWAGTKKSKDARMPTSTKRVLPKNNKKKNRKAARKGSKNSSEEEPWYGSEEEEEDY